MITSSIHDCCVPVSYNFALDDLSGRAFHLRIRKREILYRHRSNTLRQNIPQQLQRLKECLIERFLFMQIDYDSRGICKEDHLIREERSRIQKSILGKWIYTDEMKWLDIEVTNNEIIGAVDNGYSAGW